MAACLPTAPTRPCLCQVHITSLAWPSATALRLASASDSAVEVAQLILEHEQGDLW